MEGRTVSHYRILEKIGEGGMGEVWLAEDTRLDRKVALKFLPQYLQNDEVAQKRFVREAKSAAAIDHPYICKIYEPGETDDYSFIAMEYVEGETLQKKLDPGRLSLKETLHIASEIAEALEEAHKKGIVHRDLKPANVMLTPGGHIKVMDFGLAKRLQPRGKEEEITAALTREGTTLGTLTYMSPEQLRGKEVDTRSDIFSFGVVLYEMLTGVHPFRTGTQAETINSILNEHPSAISRYTEDTSDILEHTVEKMLAKAPAERYQSVHEVQTNLKKLFEKLSVSGVLSAGELAPKVKPRTGMWLGAAAVLVVLVAVALTVYLYQPTPEPIDSIAILPFENLNEDPDSEYLSGGIGFSIASKLAPLSGLKVIPPERLRRYKDQNAEPQTVVQELSVKSVLTGNMKVIEGTLALRVSLYDAEGSLMWGQLYSQALTDLLTIQEEIAERLVEELQLQLSGKERNLLARRPTDNFEAYEAYMNGWDRYVDWMWSSSGPKADSALEQAILYFERAIELDPEFALPYLALSGCYERLCIQGNAEYCGKQRETVEKVLEMDDTLPEAHATMGLLLAFVDRDWEAAGVEFNKARYPNDQSYAFVIYLVWMGRLEEAAEQVDRYFQIMDPLSARQISIVANQYFLAGKYDLALEKFQRAKELEPGMSVDWMIQLCFLGLGMEEEVFSGFLSSREKRDSAEELERYKQVFRKSGMQGVYRLRLDKRGRGGPGKPYDLAGIYALAGEKDLAFELLEKHYESAGAALHLVFATNPRFDSLRGDPRFEQLLRKLNLPEEAIQRHLALPSG